MVLGHPGQEISHFGELRSKIGRIGHQPGSNVEGGKTYRNRVPIKFTRRVDVRPACVDLRPSPKTDVLVFIFVLFCPSRDFACCRVIRIAANQTFSRL